MASFSFLIPKAFVNQIQRLIQFLVLEPQSEITLALLNVKGLLNNQVLCNGHEIPLDQIFARWVENTLLYGQYVLQILHKLQTVWLDRFEFDLILDFLALPRSVEANRGSFGSSQETQIIVRLVQSIAHLLVRKLDGVPLDVRLEHLQVVLVPLQINGKVTPGVGVVLGEAGWRSLEPYGVYGIVVYEEQRHVVRVVLKLLFEIHGVPRQVVHGDLALLQNVEAASQEVGGQYLEEVPSIAADLVRPDGHFTGDVVLGGQRAHFVDGLGDVPVYSPALGLENVLLLVVPELQAQTHDQQDALGVGVDVLVPALSTERLGTVLVGVPANLVQGLDAVAVDFQGYLVGVKRVVVKGHGVVLLLERAHEAFFGGRVEHPVLSDATHINPQLRLHGEVVY